MDLRFKIVALLSVFILVSCSAKPAIRVNAGGVEMDLTREAPLGSAASLSSDGRYLLTKSFNDDFVRLWDIFTGTQISVMPVNSNGPVAITPDGKHALIGGELLTLWDLESGKKLRTYGDSPATTISLSSDGRRVLTHNGGFAMKRFLTVYDVGSGRKISEMPIRNFVWSAALSPDGKYALSPYAGGALVLWDISRGSIIASYGGNTGGFRGHGGIFAVAFSPDGKYIAMGGSDGSIKLYDLRSGGEHITIRGHSSITASATFVNFSPDGKYVLSGGADGLVKLWDINTGREARSFKVLSSGNLAMGVNYASITRDGKYMATQSQDASVRVWDISTGEEVAVLISFVDGEWLAVTSEGYYNSSEKGAQYLKVNLEEKDYSVDQFYDVFYRPDIVAAKLKGEDIKGLVTITMRDAVKSPPPTVAIAPPKNSDSAKVKVCYSIKNTGGGIGEVRVFHNGKLIESDGYYKDIARSQTEKSRLSNLDSRTIYSDMRSVTVTGRAGAIAVSAKAKGDMLEDCREIDALPGENEVSVAAFNSGNTVQSPLKTIGFKSGLPPVEPHMYILAIGIDKYRDEAVNLNFAVKDARDLEEKLRAQSATLYKAQNIHYTLLTDKEATKATISGKIEELANTIKPGDSFIFFAAGHGVLLQNQYYMLTHDYDGALKEEGMISSNEIVEMSKKIKSLSQLFVFDTCHAGGVDTIVSGLYDARMSVLAKKMGLHIYASASGRQAAMDGYKGNGLFTHTLLKGLNNNRDADKNKDGKVTIVGLGDYSKRETTSISRQIGHTQTPLIINFGKDSPLYKLQ